MTGAEDVPEPDGGSSAEAADSYLSSIEELLGLLLEETPFVELLEQVLTLTARAVPAADAVAVTVERIDGRKDTAAASDPVARAFDEVQRELDEGPCVEALRTGAEVHVGDVRVDQRWSPRLREAATRHGLAAVLAIPLTVAGATVGSLNLFSRTPDGFDAEARRTAHAMAGPVASTLSNARAFRQAEQLGEQLRRALESRAVIEQAKGILMVRADCDEDAAFAMLRRTSQHQNRKLYEVAADLVAMRDRLPPV